jgi:rhodanese-related sulfurtransferase
MTPTPENETCPIEIDVHEVKQLIDNQAEFLLVDCRESDENKYCQIDGCHLLPMNETPNRLSELEPHRQSQIVVYCHHGGRSFQVVQWLRSQGFSQAQNMSGGIDAWSQAIDPSIPRY